MNRRPLGPEPSALPPALLPVRRFFRREKNTHSLEWVVTGATGLEPAISGVTGQRDNQLRYAPVVVHYSIFLFFMSSIAKKYCRKNICREKMRTIFKSLCKQNRCGVSFKRPPIGSDHQKNIPNYRFQCVADCCFFLVTKTY